MDNLFVIKIGGNIIDDDAKLLSFLNMFASVPGKKILIHGGGKLATGMAEKMGIPQQLIDGRRITDAETLKIVTMVYAGLINKQIVATLQANNCNAAGLCGADGNTIKAHKRVHAQTDYGFAGDVDDVNSNLVNSLLNLDISLVIAPITHDKKGQLLNTNADTIAQEIAREMAKLYNVQLIFTFEKNGVLTDINDDSSVIPELTLATYKELKEENKIFAGMIPKLDNAFSALDKGVSKVIIGKAENLMGLIEGKAGTSIINV